MPLVTVLLPVYNGERFLADAITSVLNQTFGDFELLVVDDGSTDGSAGILNSFNDPRIRVLKNEERLKLSGALNRGMDNSSGTYIARMDADDICLPDRLSRQVRFMESHLEVGMCGGWVKAFGDHPSSGSIFKYPLTSEAIKATLLFDNPFAHPAVMLRKSLFNKFNLRFDGSYYPAEDYELWVRALEYFPAANMAEVLLNYHLHPASMTLSGMPEMDLQACRILRPLFADLRVTPSDSEMVFHRSVSSNRLAPDWQKDSVTKAERWLIGLVRTNDVAGRYDKPAFRKAAAQVWYSVCYRSLGFGWAVVRRYLTSELCLVPGDSIALMCAMIKRSLTVGR